MSADRELLELAAKAAGIQYDADASKPHPKSGAFWGLWLEFDREPSEYSRRYWNPLTDDGDAFRLAVLRGLFYAPEFFHFLALERAAADADYDDRKGYRRAIVRAAAAIGEAMP